MAEGSEVEGFDPLPLYIGYTGLHKFIYGNCGHNFCKTRKPVEIIEMIKKQLSIIVQNL